MNLINVKFNGAFDLKSNKSTRVENIYLHLRDIRIRTQIIFVNSKQNGGFKVNNFRIITITHKTANINHIGRYIPPVNADQDQLADKLRQIKEELGLDELLYLATCNRLMFFFVQEQEIDKAFLMKLFALLHPDMPALFLRDLLDVVAIYNGLSCVEHIFKVASSLDSLVVGEREILRQLRKSYEFCRKHKLTGDNIRMVIEMAIPVGKEVYTRTKIGENSVSVVSLAMRKMMHYHPNKDARFLIVGAGQTNNLVAKFLLKHEFKHFTVFNRSLDNARYLAEKIGGTACTLDQLADYRENFDVIIVCTGAAEPLVTKELYANLIGNDKTTKIIIDLAVPNDVCPDVVEAFPIHYIEVEKLRLLAEHNLSLRKQEVEKALHLIEDRLEEFKIKLRDRRVERAMSSVIPARVKAVKQRAVNLVFQKEISDLDANAQETLEKVLAYMERKYIGIPITVARSVLKNELQG